MITTPRSRYQPQYPNVLSDFSLTSNSFNYVMNVSTNFSVGKL